jgi:tetratricopeptide (TPR) repeat protein
MLVPLLIALVIIFGMVLVYVYILSPRLNPRNRADNFLSQNMVDQALLEYKKILDDNPGDFTVHWKLANIFFSRDQIDEGVLHLEEILRINKFNYEVEKASVERKLAEAYLVRDDTQKAFQNYFEILKAYPGDEEALFHVAFILLGQEYFDLAQRYFDRLVKVGEKNFTRLFGAGIASYQNQKANEPAEYFREALTFEPHSDIANLAMAFALQRKMDYKAALNYARMIIDSSSDENALFVARRLYGILCVQAKRPAEGVKMLETLLAYARDNEMNDEIVVILYDLGFAALHAEMTELAYDFWNQVYQLDRGFRNIQHLATLLRREMDSTGKPGPGVRDSEGSVIDYADDWLRDVFHPNFLWNVCGLKSDTAVDLSGVLAAARADALRDEGQQKKKSEISRDASEKIQSFIGLDVENFRIISNRITTKLGYRVDEILPTYREGDGVDFLAYHLATKEKTLIWVRRWKDIRISEIPLRNLAQAVNDIKADQGLFITTSDLSDAALAAVERLSRVKVVLPNELGALLADFV